MLGFGQQQPQVSNPNNDQIIAQPPSDTISHIVFYPTQTQPYGGTKEYFIAVSSWDGDVSCAALPFMELLCFADRSSSASD